jgi:hypothetical protein
MTNAEYVSLKEYFDRVMMERDKALTAALASAKEAVLVAEANAENWRKQQNEWRAAMNDRDQTYLTKAEFSSFRDSNQRTLKEFSDFKEVHSGTVGEIENLKIVVDGLKTFRDNMQGKATQSSVTIVTIISILSLAIALMGIMMRLFAGI